MISSVGGVAQILCCDQLIVSSVCDGGGDGDSDIVNRIKSSQ